MNESFIPLLPHSAETAEPAAAQRVRVLTAPPAQPFQPLASNLPNPAPCTQGRPSITLERDGERVTRVRIECSCGQLLEMECVY